MASGEETGTLLQSSLQFQWAIEDIFSYMEKDESFTLRSPYFPVAGFMWYLRFHPFTIHESVEWTSVFLNFTMGSSVKKKLNYTFGVKKVDGTIMNVGKFENSGFEISNSFSNTSAYSGCGWKTFLERSELLERKDELAPSGVLTITCTFKQNDRVEPILPPILGSLISLSSDLLSMFTSKSGCDATVNVQGQEFPVHKLILMSRSPILRVMFEAEMKEKSTGNVDIEDCTPKVFQDFLMYLYSGIFQNSANDVFQLYCTAHKYDVKYLMSDCVDYMIKNLSIDNVVDAILLGEQFNEVNLKSRAQDFLNRSVKEIVHNAKRNSFWKDNLTISDEMLKVFEKYIEAETKNKQTNYSTKTNVSIICLFFSLFLAVVIYIWA